LVSGTIATSSGRGIAGRGAPGARSRLWHRPAASPQRRFVAPPFGFATAFGGPGRGGERGDPGTGARTPVGPAPRDGRHLARGAGESPRRPVARCGAD